MSVLKAGFSQRVGAPHAPDVMRHGVNSKVQHFEPKNISFMFPFFPQEIALIWRERLNTARKQVFGAQDRFFSKWHELVL